MDINAQNGYSGYTLHNLMYLITLKNLELNFPHTFSSKLAMTFLLNSTSPYTTFSRDPKENFLFIEKMTNIWIQQFMFTYNIIFYHKENV